MFNLGFSEVVVILIVALIVLGPSKLPDLARSIGKGMREIKKATDELKGVWDEQVSDTLRDEIPSLKPPDIRAAARQALDQAWPEDLPGRPGPGPGAGAASEDTGPDVTDPGGPQLAAEAPRPAEPTEPAAPSPGGADPAPDASEPTGGDKHSA